MAYGTARGASVVDCKRVRRAAGEEFGSVVDASISTCFSVGSLVSSCSAVSEVARGVMWEVEEANPWLSSAKR